MIISDLYIIVNMDSESPSQRSWRVYLTEELSKKHTDLILLFGCFATGLLDAAVFNVWSCFVSMQTGMSLRVHS